MFFFRKRPKVFCVGVNKTGATSIEAVFRSLKLKVGDQGAAELLIHDCARGDFTRIVRYCRKAHAFQDAPFGWPGTYEAVDKAFPGSKFILTVRESADEWFDSLVRFHTKLLGKGRIPTAEDLRQFGYRYPGFLWDVQRLRFGADEASLYEPERYKRAYEDHNRNVRDYFRDRPGDLLELNVADESAMERLLAFLGHRYTGQPMPHENRSKDR